MGIDKSPDIESKIREFYDNQGWGRDDAGNTLDARLSEDLRACAAEYVSACRRKLLAYLPRTGERILDAASGPVQYPEYLEYSKGFSKRVCVDISQSALDQAKTKLGAHGEYLRASILDLPFPDNHFDAVISLHTIYHIDQELQEAAVRQLIRVAKPETNVVIVYSNPDRLVSRVRRLFVTPPPPDPNDYFFAHSLSWWSRFADACSLAVLPWRAVAAREAKMFIPDNRVGRALYRWVLSFERAFSGLATRLGTYPMVVLTKKPA